MAPSLDVPQLVLQRAMSNGSAGQRWLDDLPDVVESLARKWRLDLGPSLVGGTASFVCVATDEAGRPCVLKVAMPLDIEEVDAFRRAVLVHELAEGHGCATERSQRDRWVIGFKQAMHDRTAGAHATRQLGLRHAFLAQRGGELAGEITFDAERNRLLDSLSELLRASGTECALGGL